MINSFEQLAFDDKSIHLNEVEYSPGGIIDRYESIYAVLARFALANTLSKRHLMDLFKSKVPMKYTGAKNLSDIKLVDSAQVMRRLAVSASQLDEMFFSWRPGLKRSAGCLYFRYCSICASAHRHYTIFQAETLRRCPFHSFLLRTACTYCGQSTLYNWISPLLTHPFRCARCREPLGVQHGNVAFFDLHTTTRAERIAWANGQRSAVPPSNSAVSPACPGYIVYGSRDRDFEQWCAMTSLPLYGHDWTTKDWSSCAGFIQVRGARVESGRNRRSTRAANAQPDISRYLLQCLKSILRNLRKCWQISQRSPSTRQGLQRHREEAYRLLARHWWGDADEPCGGEGEGKRGNSLSVIDAWLCGFPHHADGHALPSNITTWFLAHRFCAWVVESIEIISKMMDRPFLGSDGALLQQIQRPHKPLWLVAFIESASCTSYRVLHYQHFPACLSLAEVWFGPTAEAA